MLLKLSEEDKFTIIRIKTKTTQIIEIIPKQRAPSL